MTFTLTQEQLEPLCEYLHSLTQGKERIFFLLNGDLGSGKTTLVREFVRYRGGRDEVSSPTFSLSQDYDGIFHYDFYQKEYNHLLELGFIELFEREGVHFIEWASVGIKELLKKCQFAIVRVDITPLDSAQREYQISDE
ncbi:tRNA (adenosine(37)-N6)-threonylcarbamoyltransferase complex ATPase subunit type 1 TsaE [uncultured Helicobacter sp.]|uniref:tRNA (adenosine(37)-N6)-threonylcarbamoyltransferase complex ATPase subunit type 1 TsaE n=1 Tax=uncultured Helicobacter sp. TaxID=175537 RepID=UPI003751FAF0